MNAQDLIEAICENGAGTDDVLVKAALEDGAVVGWLFGLAPLDPDSGVSVATHDEAQGIVEEAHNFIVKSLKLADLKKSAKLPKIATIAGRTVNLDWCPNYNRDGWQAEVDQGVLRELEKDNPSDMQAIEDELAKYGDSAMYNVDPDSGEEDPYLIVFKDLESRRPIVPALETLEYKGPITVVGVRYSLSDDGKHYIASKNLSANYQTPTVWPWEVKQYLETGELSPVLAANATTHPENLAGLNDFDKQVLRNFAASTQQDPSFFDNMPKCLQDFVRNPVFPSRNHKLGDTK